MICSMIEGNIPMLEECSSKFWLFGGRTMNEVRVKLAICIEDFTPTGSAKCL